MKTYAIIPARAGSKGVKNKNIRLLANEPLISYSIKAAISAQNFDRVIVSTDSPEIAELSKKLGAEVPFLRPAELAQDRSPDRSYIEHALNWFRDQEHHEPDLIAIIRPTTPLRCNEVLDEAVKKMKASFSEATSLRSVHPLAEPPQKMLQFADKWLTGFFPDDKRDDYFNLPRQSFPTAYCPNGYIDIIKTAYIRSEKEKIFGADMLGFVTAVSHEIDCEDDFSYLEYLLASKKHG